MKNIRHDLIGAKAYKVGYKLVGDRFYSFDIVKTFEEAVKLMKEYESKGWNPIIKPVK